MTAKIAGRRHHPAAFDVTSTLSLVHEKTNPVDSRAVAIYADGAQIGYLERGLSYLVAGLLDRGRPVFASPIERADGAINLFIPIRADRLGGNIVYVTSTDGRRTYAVDCRNAICTCPAGIYVICKHKRSLGITRKPAIVARPTASGAGGVAVAVSASGPRTAA